MHLALSQRLAQIPRTRVLSARGTQLGAERERTLNSNHTNTHTQFLKSRRVGRSARPNELVVQRLKCCKHLTRFSTREQNYNSKSKGLRFTDGFRDSSVQVQCVRVVGVVASAKGYEQVGNHLVKTCEVLPFILGFQSLPPPLHALKLLNPKIPAFFASATLRWRSSGWQRSAWLRNGRRLPSPELAQFGLGIWVLRGSVDSWRFRDLGLMHEAQSDLFNTSTTCKCSSRTLTLTPKPVLNPVRHSRNPNTPKHQSLSLKSKAPEICVTFRCDISWRESFQ